MMNPETTRYFESVKDGEPITWGWNYACRAWQDSLENEASAFEVRDLPWGSKVEEEMRDFVEALRAAGVERFVVTDQSTALVSSLHVLASLGGIIEGVATVTRNSRCWGSEERQGLAIRLV